MERVPVFQATSQLKKYHVTKPLPHMTLKKDTTIKAFQEQETVGQKRRRIAQGKLPITSFVARDPDSHKRFYMKPEASLPSGSARYVLLKRKDGKVFFQEVQLHRVLEVSDSAADISIDDLEKEEAERVKRFNASVSKYERAVLPAHVGGFEVETEGDIYKTALNSGAKRGKRKQGSEDEGDMDGGAGDDEELRHSRSAKADFVPDENDDAIDFENDFSDDNEEVLVEIEEEELSDDGLEVKSKSAEKLEKLLRKEEEKIKHRDDFASSSEEESEEEDEAEDEALSEEEEEEESAEKSSKKKAVASTSSVSTPDVSSSSAPSDAVPQEGISEARIRDLFNRHGRLTLSELKNHFRNELKLTSPQVKENFKNLILRLCSSTKIGDVSYLMLKKT